MEVLKLWTVAVASHMYAVCGMQVYTFHKSKHVNVRTCVYECEERLVIHSKVVASACMCGL